MAFPTAVNSQITDSVTQTNVETIGSAPGHSLGSLQEVLAAAMGLAMQNAVSNQQSQNEIGVAVVSKCVNYLLNVEKDKVKK